MSDERIEEVLAELADRSMLVVGDVMLDDHHWGSSRRTMSDHQVPVVEVDRTTSGLGGAGNAAANAVGFGAETYLVAVVGGDAAGAAVRQRAGALGVKTRFIEEHRRPTSRKIYLHSNGRPIVRVDREVRSPVQDQTFARLKAAAADLLDFVDVLLISDYSKGTVTERLAEVLISDARRSDVMVVVDTKAPRPDAYRGCTAVTPSVDELETWARRPLPGPSERSIAAVEIIEILDGALTLVTEGQDGMTLYSREGSHHVPGRSRGATDATGAGDTAAATFALALAARFEPIDAAALANEAAAIAVQQPGTTPVTASALRGLAWARDAAVDRLTRGTDASAGWSEVPSVLHD